MVARKRKVLIGLSFSLFPSFVQPSIHPSFLLYFFRPVPFSCQGKRSAVQIKYFSRMGEQCRTLVPLSSTVKLPSPRGRRWTCFLCCQFCIVPFHTSRQSAQDVPVSLSGFSRSCSSRVCITFFVLVSSPFRAEPDRKRPHMSVGYVPWRRHLCTTAFDHHSWSSSFLSQTNQIKNGVAKVTPVVFLWTFRGGCWKRHDISCIHTSRNQEVSTAVCDCLPGY